MFRYTTYFHNSKNKLMVQAITIPLKSYIHLTKKSVFKVYRASILLPGTALLWGKKKASLTS